MYLAHDLKHSRQVAIKLLRPDLSSSVSAGRFIREINLTANLTHPNILALYDSGSASGFLYYVMPYVEGGTFRDKLQRDGKFDVVEALILTSEIAEGLQYAHDQSVIHRDIKPENILLSHGHALIADFGIGKALVGAGAVTTTGFSMGTPLYMSPEQATAEHSLDRRTDIYALGCLLFEMLTGKPPFAGKNPLGLMAQHANAPRPSARELRPEVPPHVDAAICKAMAIEPDDRFGTTAEFVQALEVERRLTPSGAQDLRIPAATHKRQWRRTLLAGVAGVAAVVATLMYLDNSGGLPATGENYSDHPLASAFTDKVGEHFPIIASNDSLLAVYSYRAASLYTFNGTQWQSWAVPDSFELRPFKGVLHGNRILATKRRTDSAGVTMAQLWWLELSMNSLRPLEVIRDYKLDTGQPGWWSDGATVSIWEDAVSKRTTGSWVREPTGVSTPLRAMWGRDDAHRYAISNAPRDSLLVYDGVRWQLKNILLDRNAGSPEFRNGTSLADGSNVVSGQSCVADTLCTPLVLTQDAPSAPWGRIAVPEHAGLPRSQLRTTNVGCANRLDITGAGGKSAKDFYVWALWTLCSGNVARRVDEGCPRRQPCIWRVDNGILRPVRELLGKNVVGAASVMNVDYVLLNDGILWRNSQGIWTPVEQLPNLPERRVGAGTNVVVHYAGGRVTYQPSRSARSTFS